MAVKNKLLIKYFSKIDFTIISKTTAINPKIVNKIKCLDLNKKETTSLLKDKSKII